VHGLDINGDLLALAKQRAVNVGYTIDYRLGSATELPWPDESMDVCLAPELLEHVVDWKKCLQEAARILRPGGVLALSTTNKLCPIQHEFNLPAYSWYPASIKRYIENLAVTTRPGLANFATYPAVNWFTFYSLREFLSGRELVCFDRFDVIDVGRKGFIGNVAVSLIHRFSLVRWFAHVLSPATLMFAIKETRLKRNKGS
jgi:2-polyprenyl-6-hydroxyphenyl methylase/3-demethylubiquinone-9 3-methyltransferase